MNTFFSERKTDVLHGLTENIHTLKVISLQNLSESLNEYTFCIPDEEDYDRFKFTTIFFTVLESYVSLLPDWRHKFHLDITKIMINEEEAEKRGHEERNRIIDIICAGDLLPLLPIIQQIYDKNIEISGICKKIHEYIDYYDFYWLWFMDEQESHKYDAFDVIAIPYQRE